MDFKKCDLGRSEICNAFLSNTQSKYHRLGNAKNMEERRVGFTLMSSLRFACPSIVHLLIFCSVAISPKLCSEAFDGKSTNSDALSPY